MGDELWCWGWWALECDVMVYESTVIMVVQVNASTFGNVKVIDEDR